MAHLSTFEIRAFRNVRPALLECRHGLNVVLGKNAAGKTSLLNLLAKSVSPFRTEDDETRDLEPSDVVMVLRGDQGTLKRERTRPKMSTLLSQAFASLTETFELKAADETQLLKVRAQDGWLTIDGQPQVRMGGSAYASLVDHVKKTDLRTSELLRSFAELAPLRMDESLEYFERVVGYEATRTPEEAEPNFEIGQPLSFRELLLNPRQLDELGRVQMGFATRAAKVMGYDRVDAQFDVESKTTASGVQTTIANLRFIFHSLSDTFPHTRLSYGEKRLLAFFALSNASTNIMIVDELVNGLHHEWIKACLDEIGPRQAFLTSQNPLLLDYLEFESADDVQRGFILCERVRIPGKEFSELIWRNPTEEEATEFFTAYKTGVQRVSDILISKGFW